MTIAGIAPLLFNGYVNASIAQWPAVYWSFEFACWIVVPILVLGTLYRSCGLRPSHIGLNGTIFGRRSMGLVILTCVVLSPLTLWIYKNSLNYFATFLPNEGLFQYSSIVPPGGPVRTLVVIYLATTAGVVEEVFFRGLLYNVSAFLSSRVVPLFLIVSPLLFAAIHWESGPANTAAAYLVGLFAAAVYVVMRNLWPLIAAHIYTDYVDI
jgi:membrane protease YdiL (CAAX protease family)